MPSFKIKENINKRKKKRRLRFVLEDELAASEFEDVEFAKTYAVLNERNDINENDQLIIYIGATKRATARGTNIEEELKNLIREYDENGSSLEGMRF